MWLKWCTCKVWRCCVRLQQFRRCIYIKIQYLTSDLWVKVTLNVAQYPHLYVNYAPVWSCYIAKEDMDLQPWPNWSHKILLSTLNIMWPNCICKVWKCYIQQFRRRCIYKKIHYLISDLGVKVPRNVAQYLLHYVNYTLVKFEVARFKQLRSRCIYKKRDRQTDEWRTDFDMKFKYTFISIEKAGIIT